MQMDITNMDGGVELSVLEPDPLPYLVGATRAAVACARALAKNRQPHDPAGAAAVEEACQRLLAAPSSSEVDNAQKVDALAKALEQACFTLLHGEGRPNHENDLVWAPRSRWQLPRRIRAYFAMGAVTHNQVAWESAHRFGGRRPDIVRHQAQIAMAYSRGRDI
jgi:hypothetical protein